MTFSVLLILTIFLPYIVLNSKNRLFPPSRVCPHRESFKSLKINIGELVFSHNAMLQKETFAVDFPADGSFGR